MNTKPRKVHPTNGSKVFNRPITHPWRKDADEQIFLKGAKPRPINKPMKDPVGSRREPRLIEGKWVSALILKPAKYSDGGQNVFIKSGVIKLGFESGARISSGLKRTSGG